MLNRLQDSGLPVPVQDTTLSLDVLGRFICSTWDEATNNGRVQFDAIVIGSGMFGAYCAEKIYRQSNLRVLVLEAARSWYLNTCRISPALDSTFAGAAAVPNNTSDPGTKEQVWGIPWRS